MSAHRHVDRPADAGWNLIVVCREDRVQVGPRRTLKGAYTLATRQVFPTRDEAIAYAKTVHPSREPLVIEGRFFQLRKGR